jgi:thioredoxin 1
MFSRICQIDDLQQFQKGIGQGTVLVDFFASWCGPCRYQIPILEKLAKEMNREVQIAKVDIEKLPELARRYRVKSIPTLLLFRHGKLIRQFVGLQEKKILENAIHKTNAA